MIFHRKNALIFPLKFRQTCGCCCWRGGRRMQPYKADCAMMSGWMRVLHKRSPSLYMYIVFYITVSNPLAQLDDLKMRSPTAAAAAAGQHAQLLKRVWLSWSVFRGYLFRMSNPEMASATDNNSWSARTGSVTYKCRQNGQPKDATVARSERFNWQLTRLMSSRQSS